MPGTLDRLAADFAATPFARTVGIEVVAIVPDRVTVRLPHRAENANRNGALHGGVLASLVDLTGTLAAWSGRPADAAVETNTVDLGVQYLAPAVREGVIAEASVVRRGRQIVFGRVDVRSTRGRPIATAVIATRSAARVRRAPGGPQDDAFASIPADIGTRVRASGSPFSARLGVRSARLGSGQAVAFMPDQPAIAAGDGRIAGGALATLADCVAGAAAWSVDGFDPRGRAATVSMHLTCGATPRGEDVAAVARTSWRSAGLFVSTVTIGGRESHVAAATGAVTYRIVRPGD